MPEAVACALCGSSVGIIEPRKGRLLNLGESHAICRCGQCGFRYLSPRPPSTSWPRSTRPTPITRRTTRRAARRAAASTTYLGKGKRRWLQGPVHVVGGLVNRGPCIEVIARRRNAGRTTPTAQE